MRAIVGTAGWTIPTKDAAAFPAEGTSLERYAARFQAVEINSSFHREHRAATWQRWADSVPAGFRFAVKLPKTITHKRKLVDCDDLLEPFVGQVSPLGDKLAILLVQLPPKLAFDAAVAEPFLASLATRSPVRIACEPRHPSWFDAEPDALLRSLNVARVAADPAVTPSAATPGGCLATRYWRLHGSPIMYRSSYEDDRLEFYAREMKSAIGEGAEAWCMFDNTAASAATANALALMERL
ncbi:MAG TPA: DUF72 domain-containing protein [Allosphingosinicella sp.]|nr:DUF72 domain-containing protein [Allosphingosinicella sp.]